MSGQTCCNTRCNVWHKWNVCCRWTSKHCCRTIHCVASRGFVFVWQCLVSPTAIDLSAHRTALWDASAIYPSLHMKITLHTFRTYAIPGTIIPAETRPHTGRERHACNDQMNEYHNCTNQLMNQIAFLLFATANRQWLGSVRGNSIQCCFRPHDAPMLCYTMTVWSMFSGNRGSHCELIGVASALAKRCCCSLENPMLCR